jgi:hypothetical protein
MISLNIVNQLVCVMELRVFFEVGIDFFYIIQISKILP